jgi:hypothetical protein
MVTLRSESFSPTVGGVSPSSGLVQAGDSFYGTTLGRIAPQPEQAPILPPTGSASAADVTDKPGTIFKLTDEGKLSTLYTFSAMDQYGNFTTLPESGLVGADDGNFYGITRAITNLQRQAVNAATPSIDPYTKT